MSNKKLQRRKQLRALGRQSKIKLEQPVLNNPNQPLPVGLGGEIQLSAAEEAEFSFLNQYAACNASLDPTEAIEYATVLREKATAALKEEFFNSEKNRLLQVILDRFMLGGIMARQDQVGGNVDTIHNARNEVWATEEARQKYQNRGDYKEKKAAYHSHENYKKINIVRLRNRNKIALFSIS